jgi:broad specificity phosphatase PhoE
MAVFYLIRHGQASFGSSDYDQLSAVGERQAKILGHHMGRFTPHLDAAFAGTHTRQQRTAELTADAMGISVGLGTLSAFDEYDYRRVIQAYLPRFMAEVGGDRGLDEGEIMKDPRLFDLAFRFMIRAWMANHAHDGEPFETFQAFCNRVCAGIEAILKSCDAKARIAIFTSGGTIAVLLRSVLGLSNKRTLSVNWSIYNASVTQLYYGRSHDHHEALLMGFNNISHLELTGDRDLITFR